MDCQATQLSYVHTYIHIRIRTYIRTYIYVYIHTCIHKRTRICTYMHTYTYTYIHTYIRMYVHTHYCSHSCDHVLAMQKLHLSLATCARTSCTTHYYPCDSGLSFHTAHKTHNKMRHRNMLKMGPFQGLSVHN